MSLTVTIPDTFNGPLDLLLHLIRRDEMDIHDIPIAKLTQAYLEEIRARDLVNMDEAAEFLDLASRLIDIKSRMLLPPEERDEAEEEEEADPRSGLVEALLEYRRFKDASRLLSDLAEEQARRYPRVSPPMAFRLAAEEEEPKGPEDLFSAFQNLFLRLAPDNDSNVITYTEVPTTVRIEQIETVLRDMGKTRFSLLLSGKPNRREMVGFFIAMLEMIRQGKLVARQAANFSDIILERRESPAAAERKPAFRRSRPARCFPAAPAKAERNGGQATAAASGRFPVPAPHRLRGRGRLLRSAPMGMSGTSLILARAGR